jgi:hypothetical protein
LSHSQPTRMIKFEVVLAHSRLSEEVSLDQLQSKPKAESEHLMDNITKIVNSNEATQEHGDDISTTDNNQALLLSATARTPTRRRRQLMKLVCQRSPRCWAGIETSANIILPDRYAREVVVAQRKPDWYSAAQWIFVSAHLTIYLFHATRSLRSFGLTPLLCNPCLLSITYSLQLD